MEAASSLFHIGVVSETQHLKFSELTRASAALQKQVARDLTPLWGIRATVNAFATLEDVPTDYWPMIVRDDIQFPGAAGIHLDKDGHPFALVQYSKGWSLTASHEAIEMLCDPFGNRVIAGQSPKPQQGRVEFLVEPCDPSEADEFAYSVNGIRVSDFYTPAFFDPVASAGTRYSYTGAIKKPREVLKGGYLSWHDPVGDHWWQVVWFGAHPEFRDLGVLAQAEGSIRTQIYKKTPEAFDFQKPSQHAALGVMAAAETSVTDASAARAKSLHAQVKRLLSGN